MLCLRTGTECVLKKHRRALLVSSARLGLRPRLLSSFSGMAAEEPSSLPTGTLGRPRLVETVAKSCHTRTILKLLLSLVEFVH